MKVFKVPSHWSKSTSFLIGWIWVYKLQPIWTNSFSLQPPNWKHLREDLQIPWRWENCCKKLWKLRGRKLVSQLKWICKMMETLMTQALEKFLDASKPFLDVSKADLMKTTIQVKMLNSAISNPGENDSMGYILYSPVNFSPVSHCYSFKADWVSDPFSFFPLSYECLTWAWGDLVF